MLSQSVSWLGWERGLKMDEGMVSLKMGARKTGRAPRPRQRRCSFCERGTVLRDCPPYSTHAS